MCGEMIYDYDNNDYETNQTQEKISNVLNCLKSTSATSLKDVNCCFNTLDVYSNQTF